MMEEIFGLPTNHHVSNMNTNDFMDLAIARNNISQSLSNNSTNYSEEVRVPSSEHVAEIVGRQGCKVKQLRAKTNTYIKTPEKEMEPVFVITGRLEDVKSAKKQIIEAADHFTNIRASRRTNGTSGPLPDVPGQITIRVPVPVHLVGLVVGSKGATIKRIQQSTQTHIITPSRDKDPVFEITGLPENVMSAERKMKDHIKLRTGVDGGAATACLRNLQNDLKSPDLLPACGLNTNTSSTSGITGFWNNSLTRGYGYDMNSLSSAMALLDFSDMRYDSGMGASLSSQGSSFGSSSESSPTINNTNLNSFILNSSTASSSSSSSSKNRCSSGCMTEKENLRHIALECGHTNVFCTECLQMPPYGSLKCPICQAPQW